VRYGPDGSHPEAPRSGVSKDGHGPHRCDQRRRAPEILWTDLRCISAINVLGLPSAVVPAARYQGKPIGVQLITGRYREDLALDAAGCGREARRHAGGPALGQDGLSGIAASPTFYGSYAG
jgi:hypothetical protein